MINMLLESFLQRQWLVELSATLLFVLVFNFFVKRVLKLLQQRFKKKGGYFLAGFFDALYVPLRAFVWIFAAVYSILVIDKTVNLPPVCGELPREILFISGIILAGWFLLRWKRHVVKTISMKSYKGKIQLDPHRINAMDKLLTISILFTTMIWLLEATGQGVGTLLTIGGIGAAAIGFASKEFIANFFGGFMIYLNTPFHIGDLIDIPSRTTKGIVEEIGWYLTRIRDIEKQPIYIPNAMFSQFIVVNLSKRSHRRITDTIGIGYEYFEAIQPIINDVKKLIDEHPQIDHEMVKWVNFSNYADSTLDIVFSAYTKVKPTKEYNMIKENILLSIHAIVNKHGASFAYQTITIDKKVP